MNIVGAVAIAAFGHDSDRPKRKAVLLCLSVFSMSILFGTLAAVQVRQASALLHAWPYPYDILFALTFCLQLVVLVCLLSSRGILNTEATTARLLHLLPLTEFKRWWLVHMPQLLLLALAVIASVPALQTCISMLGLSPLWSLAITSCGSLSALGLCYGLPYKGALRFCLNFLCVTLEAWLLRLILDATVSSSTKNLYYCLFSLLLITLMITLRFANRVQPTAKLPYVTIHLPTRLWYVTKIMRSYTGRTSFLFALLCTAFVVAGAAYIHENSTDLLCTTSGLILASFCSDIRSLADVRRPPEVTAFRGTWYFIRKQMYSVAVGLFAVTPIILYLAAIHTIPAELITGALTILVGAVAGLFAATIIGAKARDISSQCAAVFVGCVLFYACNRLAVLFGNSTISVAVMLCVLTAILVLLTFGAEYKRNTYIWRKNYDQK